MRVTTLALLEVALAIGCSSDPRNSPPDMEPAQTMTLYGVATTHSVSDSGVTDAPSDLSSVHFSSFSSASGALERHDGTGTANGTFTVPVEPGATDWQLGYQFGTGTPEFVVSHAISPDFSLFQWGRADRALPTLQTNVTLTLTGLTAWQTTDSLQLMSSNVGAVVYNLDHWTPDRITPGMTSLANETLDWKSTRAPLIDAAKGDKTQIYQLVTDAAGDYLALGKLATLTNFTTTDGAPSTLTADLNEVRQDKTFTLHFEGSLFEEMRTAVGPDAEPAFQMFIIRAFPDSNLHRSFAPTLMRLFARGAPTDLDRTVAYANPFSTGGVPWDELAVIEYVVDVPVLAAGARDPVVMSGGYDATFPLASITGGNVTPLVTPVRGVKVGGLHVSTPKTGVGLTPLVTWSAPTTGTPTSYSVLVSEVKLATDGSTDVHGVALFHTTATSLRLPPTILANDASYMLTITAHVAPETDIATTPLLHGLSEATATSFTAQFKP